MTPSTRAFVRLSVRIACAVLVLLFVWAWVALTPDAPVVLGAFP